MYYIYCTVVYKTGDAPKLKWLLGNLFVMNPESFEGKLKTKWAMVPGCVISNDLNPYCFQTCINGRNGGMGRLTEKFRQR